MTVLNSTISGNSSLSSNYSGGGICHQSGSLTITNSTITNNSADGADSASGIYSERDYVTIQNTIVAANVNNSIIPDVKNKNGRFISGDFNLIGNDGSTTGTGFNYLGDQTGTSLSLLDPLLDPLGDYGGMTETHRLHTNSTAIDKGFGFQRSRSAGHIFRRGRRVFAS